MKKIEMNDTVKVHYTGTLDNGQIFDTSYEREPLEFKVGDGSLIPGFEKGVIGMQKDEKKKINIPSAEAYGPRREEMVQKIEKSMLPPEMKPEVGMQLMAQSQEGQQQVVTVAAVEENTVSIDYNHPLAGKDLTFEIEVIEIK